MVRNPLLAYLQYHLDLRVVNAEHGDYIIVILNFHKEFKSTVYHGAILWVKVGSLKIM